MILHVDMDAFYASVEERDRPELKNRPVIVGGSASGRGVVSAANYAARRYGVHSAMPTSQAMRLCPQAVLLKTRMGLYAAISQQIREIFHRFTPQVEPLSLDEAFLDVAGSEQLFGSAECIGRAIKQAIWEELSLVASVGVAPNKFLAKLASDLEKPDGFTVIPSDRILQTLAPLPVSRLWGVGKATEIKFRQARIATFGDLQSLSKQHALQLFGRSGEHFWNLAHGIDGRRVVPDRAAKTISHEHTFPVDIEDLEILRSWLLELTEQVTGRLRAHRKLGRSVHLKVRYSDYHTITRSRSVPQATDSTDAVWCVVADLLERELPDRQLRVRLIGLGVSNLEVARVRQLELFDEGGEVAASRSLDSTTDLIRKQFGREALRRASTLRPRVE